MIGVLTFASMLLWLLVITVLLAPGILLKALIPIPSWRRWCTRYLVGVAELWSLVNHLLYRLLHDVRWQVTVDGRIDSGRSYLLVCNHQSWADILVLCDLLVGRTRFPRFFLKKELIWVPIIGVTCWALDMPFMQRHSREAITRKPQLRDDDLRATRLFCEKYRREPITAVNFLEGTRFSEAKRLDKQPPFRHLLRPKSAGLAFMLNAMGDQFAGLLDVTIAYRPPPAGSSLVWSWLCGRQQTLLVQAQLQPIPSDLIAGDYEGDAIYRQRFQEWVNELWLRKDAQLAAIKARALDDTGPPHASSHKA